MTAPRPDSATAEPGTATVWTPLLGLTAFAGWGPADRAHLTAVAGGVTAPPGFRGGAARAGLKPSGRPDLSLVAADTPCTAAVALTTNRFLAAPCVITGRNAANGRAQAVVINSGSANACTGPDGLADAELTTEAVARELGLPPMDVLVCSTGLIGVPLAMDRLLGAVPSVVADLSPDGGHRAAGAIATTDTVTKEAAYRIEDATGTCVVGGMAKGAGMIEPAMATMLAVITTDAPVPHAVLRPMVRQVVERTFNRITVDGCGSTNDSVIVLAAGTASRPPSLPSFRSALEAVCADLAQAIVADGEGTTKVVAITVRGAEHEGAAVALGRAIAGSALVRAALAGGDPNWGRVLAAMGASAVPFEPDRVAVEVAAPGHGPAVLLCRDGAAVRADLRAAARILAGNRAEIRIDLGLGAASATVLTADLTPDYVRFNAEYTT